MIPGGPGRLNRSVQIQARSTDIDDNSPALSWRDARSGAATQWSTVATVRAAINSVSGNELVAGPGPVGETRYRVFIRYKAFPALTESHRLVVTTDAEQSPPITKTMDIEAILPFERDYFQIICSEGTNNG